MFLRLLTVVGAVGVVEQLTAQHVLKLEPKCWKNVTVSSIYSRVHESHVLLCGCQVSCGEYSGS